jgi:hypothetical protein
MFQFALSQVIRLLQTESDENMSVAVECIRVYSTCVWKCPQLAFEGRSFFEIINEAYPIVQCLYQPQNSHFYHYATLMLSAVQFSTYAWEVPYNLIMRPLEIILENHAMRFCSVNDHRNAPELVEDIEILTRFFRISNKISMIDVPRRLEMISDHILCAVSVYQQCINVENQISGTTNPAELLLQSLRELRKSILYNALCVPDTYRATYQPTEESVAQLNQSLGSLTDCALYHYNSSSPDQRDDFCLKYICQMSKLSQWLSSATDAPQKIKLFLESSFQVLLDCPYREDFILSFFRPICALLTTLIDSAHLGDLRHVWRDYLIHDDGFSRIVDIMLEYMSHPSREIARYPLEVINALTFLDEDSATGNFEIGNFEIGNFASVFYGKFTYRIIRGVFEAIFNSNMHQGDSHYYVSILRRLFCIIRFYHQQSCPALDSSHQPITITSMSDYIRDILQPKYFMSNEIVELVNFFSTDCVSYLEFSFMNTEDAAVYLSDFVCNVKKLETPADFF